MKAFSHKVLQIIIQTTLTFFNTNPTFGDGGLKGCNKSIIFHEQEIVRSSAFDRKTSNSSGLIIVANWRRVDLLCLRLNTVRSSLSSWSKCWTRGLTLKPRFFVFCRVGLPRLIPVTVCFVSARAGTVGLDRLNFLTEGKSFLSVSKSLYIWLPGFGTELFILLLDRIIRWPRVVRYHAKYVVGPLSKENRCIISLMFLRLLSVVFARAHLGVFAHLTLYFKIFPFACRSKKLENFLLHSFFYFFNVVQTWTSLFLHIFFQWNVSFFLQSVLILMYYIQFSL
jgi:hypothetical protein